MKVLSTRAGRDVTAGMSRRELMAGTVGALGTALSARTLAAAATGAQPPEASASKPSWSERQFDVYLAGQRGLKPPRTGGVEFFEPAAPRP